MVIIIEDWDYSDREALQIKAKIYQDLLLLSFPVRNESAALHYLIEGPTVSRKTAKNLAVSL